MSDKTNQTYSPRPIFVIPARGGSKGIPMKNIADICGRPMIAYSIEAAITTLNLLNRESTTEYLYRDRIIVTTDCAEIAAKAEEAGVKVPFLRPAELSTDTAGSREVIIHAMNYADSQAIDYNCVILLQPTSPFRNGNHVVDALRLYSPKTTDMVVSVCQASSNPYYNCFETDPTTGYLHISKGDGKLTRRQDAPMAWEYNGAIYIINPESIRRMSLGSFPRRIPFEMTAEDSLDIDRPLDLTIARLLMTERLAKLTDDQLVEEK